MSFGSVLKIVFIFLKLVDVIACSWVWLVSPLWIGLIIDIVLVTIYAIIKVHTDF